MIPFSPPRIDEVTVEAVSDALRSGWITTGPRTKQFERSLEAYTGSQKVICLNSWTNAVELVLRWYGIGEGDEVIVPAYTYAATANIVLHVGARPVMVDSMSNSFNIGPEQVRQALSPRTKAVMPVDIGGFPCDYTAIMEALQSADFTPNSEQQSKLGRPLLIADAAHSIGAQVDGKPHGTAGDFAGFSFHAVKNLTTAEGGALAINLPAAFNSEAVYRWLNTMSLHGQSKDALAKTSTGAWRYDIIAPGFKCNMTDIQAAIGQVELDRYAQTLARRQAICERYEAAFQQHSWAICPELKSQDFESSYHLYMLRVSGASEAQRDAVIQRIYEKQVSVNVHFQPLPLLTAYHDRGYRAEDYPNAMEHYSHEISLPVYYDLSDQQVDQVIAAVIQSVEEVLA